jgi:hypothetical protein
MVNMKLMIVAGVLAGCVTETEVSHVAQELGCQSWGCGTNSPTVGDGLLFDELDSSGQYANHGGIFLGAAKLADGTPVSVHVEEDMLVAETTGGARYTGLQLEGTIIRLHHKIGDYELLIDRVYLQQLWFWSGWGEHVPSYDIKARKLGADKFEQYACGEPLIADPHWATIPHAAIVFQGDRYDPERKLVWETPATDPWFNVACAATTPAKLHLMRHTRAGSYRDDHTIGWDTNTDERQAMLKMLAADFCGTGETFTKDGVPLSYYDSNGWYREGIPYSAQEALWSKDGPICLDNPRLGRTKQEVEETCGYEIPACGSFIDFWNPWYFRAHVMSGLVP